MCLQFRNCSIKCFPEHPEIKQRIKTPPLTAQWRLERLDLWLNYCSSNFKEVEIITTDNIFVKTSIKNTLKLEQSACKITQLIKVEKYNINVHHNQSHRFYVPKQMQSHWDGTVTLSLGLFAAGGLFLWSNLLFHTDTEREGTSEGLRGLAGDATICTVPSLGMGTSKRAERVQRGCVRVWMNKGLGDKVKRKEVEEGMGGKIEWKYDKEEGIKGKGKGHFTYKDWKASYKNVVCATFLALMQRSGTSWNMSTGLQSS